MSEEQWRNVSGYKGLYSVSDQGRVRRHQARVWVRRNDHSSHYKTYPARILRPIRAGLGYRVVQLYRDDVLIRSYVHRLVYETFIGPIPPGLQINHIDAVRSNNALANLEVVTRKGNMAHAMRLGRIGRGEKHYKAKLSDAAARAAYERVVLHGERIGHVAVDLGVQRQLIGGITSGRTYRHLGLERVVFGGNGKPRVGGGVHA